MEGGNPRLAAAPPPMLLVFGGTIGAAIAGGTMARRQGRRRGARCGRSPGRPSRRRAGPRRRQAGRARPAARACWPSRTRSSDVDDDVPRKRGVTLAIDGTDPEELREILEAEVHAKRAADKHAAKFFADAGGYAPTIGIIGTVMGLVHVLENLAQPEKLGHLIAGAFVATLWGVMSANVIWLPIGSRLKRLSELEAARMEMAIEGVLADPGRRQPADRRPEAAARCCRRTSSDVEQKAA